MIEGYERWADVEIARERKAGHLWKKNEIALVQLEWANSVRIKKARAIEKKTEGGILISRLSYTPLSRTTHDL